MQFVISYYIKNKWQLITSDKMILTDVKKQKNNKNKVSLFVDNDYFGSLFDVVFAVSGLRIGDEISQEFFDELKKTSEGKLAFDKALHFLSYRLRSEKEIREYLEKKDFYIQAIEYAIEKLFHYKYIDDAKLAYAILNDYGSIKRKGRRYIEFQMIKHKIQKKTIELVLDDFDEDTELDNAIIMLEKYEKKYSNEENLYKKRQKIYQAMSRTGYCYDIINSAIHISRENDE